MPGFCSPRRCEMDRDDLDSALHEISMMVMVALEAAGPLVRSDVEPGFFGLPAADAHMLTFSLHDLRRRITELMAEIDASSLGIESRAAAIPQYA
jgi:hypothetical protein